MRLVLLGAPGAGKGTQAEILSKLLDIPTISTGNVLRAAMQMGSSVGQKIRPYMDSGRLVPDAIILDVIRERLSRGDCARGYILDGVPRTIAQAEAMEQMGLDPDCALSIETDDQVIIDRMPGRRVCRNCGGTFHIVGNPPKVDGVCDFCGGELTVRKDDAPETVKARLITYHAETEPLKSFYAARGKLRTVDSQSTVDATADCVRQILEI